MNYILLALYIIKYVYIYIKRMCACAISDNSYIHQANYIISILTEICDTEEV